jgi:hypothetical protein
VLKIPLSRGGQLCWTGWIVLAFELLYFVSLRREYPQGEGGVLFNIFFHPVSLLNKV